ncbi:MAG TPA: M23 family metallopeptidase [Egibacteraceae bacterium]|nr:M23 family metallopeptidase [Egibacteraceae bacterium]
MLATVLSAVLLAAAVLPPVAGPVTRGFDPPPVPYAAGHRGVDLDAAPGEAVRAVLPGVVRFEGTVARVGWVSVDHGGGLVTTYGPLDPRLVAAGGRVRAGDVLGLVADGSRRLDWGARLHGAYLDPLSLLRPWEPFLLP